MYCPKCGKQLPEDAHYCDACGEKLESQSSVMNSENETTGSTGFDWGDEEFEEPQVRSAPSSPSGDIIVNKQHGRGYFSFIGIGMILLVLGVIIGLAALNMDVSVLTEYGDSVNNIGLMNERSAELGFAGLLILIAVILISVASLRKDAESNETKIAPPKLAQPAVLMKKCPFCAEDIRKEAKVCRYCGRDLPVE